MMTKYRVYHHPIKGYEPVKVGFSWPIFFLGFFFLGFIWMLVKKLWGWAALWVVLILLLIAIDLLVGHFYAMGAYITEDLVNFTAWDHVRFSPGLYVYRVIGTVGFLSLWLTPAFKLNIWLEKNLLNRGFQLLSTVQSKTTDAAIAEVAKKNVGKFD